MPDCLAERGAKKTFPRKSEEVQNSFSILHLANFMRYSNSKKCS
jgi:hypothetical protein